jgi:hypothetical protein
MRISRLKGEDDLTHFIMRISWLKGRNKTQQISIWELVD